MNSRFAVSRTRYLFLSLIILLPVVAHADVLPVEDGLVVWLDATQLNPGLNGNNNITWTDMTGTLGVGDGVSQNASNWQGGPTFRINQVNQRPGVDFGGGGAYQYLVVPEKAIARKSRLVIMFG